MKNLVTVLAGVVLAVVVVATAGCGNTKEVETTEVVVMKTGYEAVAEKFFNDYVEELEEGLDETRQEMKEEGKNLDEMITVSYRYEYVENDIYDYIAKCDMYDGNVVEIHFLVDVWEENYDEIYYFTLNGDRVLEDVIDEMYEDVFYF